MEDERGRPDAPAEASGAGSEAVSAASGDPGALETPSAPMAVEPAPEPAGAGVVAPEPPQPPRGPGRPRPPRGPRPDLAGEQTPVFCESGGFRLRLEPPDLARLRELPGAKGKTDAELGREFFDGQAARFAAALAEDLTPPAEIRVVVDPYSRQAFLALENRIRGILSF